MPEYSPRFAPLTSRADRADNRGGGHSSRRYIHCYGDSVWRHFCCWRRGVVRATSLSLKPTPDAVAATPTWDQVYSIFERECAPCHTEGDDDELDEDKGGTGAMTIIGGAEPDLSTCIGIIENLDDAMASIFDKNDMPPGAWPRLTSEERLILQRWMEQGEDAPCK